MEPFPYPIIQSWTDDGRRVRLPIRYVSVYCSRQEDPNHKRYGQVMLDTWKQCRDEPGMLWLEGDIAIEPLHLTEVENGIVMCPGGVVAVPFRLYPVSTQGETITWPFYVPTEAGGERILRADEPIPLAVRSFGLGCTFLPMELFRAIGDKIKDCDWPSLDWRLSVAAREAGIPIITTPTPAVHLHY